MEVKTNEDEMRSAYKIIDKDGIYFLTSTIIEWIPVFTYKDFFEILIQSFKYCMKDKGLKIYAFVILDNHFHLIASGENISAIIQSLKSYTSKKIIEHLQRFNKNWLLNQLTYYKKQHKMNSTYQLWQEGFHPKLITTEKMLYQKIEYIHNNPVRRGYVDKPEYWYYSSARNIILGDESVIKINLFDDMIRC
jgi:REP element-mobilizing transposase RayT